MSCKVKLYYYLCLTNEKFFFHTLHRNQYIHKVLFSFDLYRLGWRTQSMTVPPGFPSVRFQLTSWRALRFRGLGLSHGCVTMASLAFLVLSTHLRT